MPRLPLTSASHCQQHRDSLSPSSRIAPPKPLLLIPMKPIVLRRGRRRIIRPRSIYRRQIRRNCILVAGRRIIVSRLIWSSRLTISCRYTWRLRRPSGVHRCGRNRLSVVIVAFHSQLLVVGLRIDLGTLRSLVRIPFSVRHGAEEFGRWLDAGEDLDV